MKFQIVLSRMSKACAFFFAALLSLVVATFSGDARGQNIESCYHGICYSSLAEAEDAMRQQACGSELELVSAPLVPITSISNTTGLATLAYDIMNRDAAEGGDFYQMDVGHAPLAPTGCSSVFPPIGQPFCGSEGETVSDMDQRVRNGQLENGQPVTCPFGHTFGAPYGDYTVNSSQSVGNIWSYTLAAGQVASGCSYQVGPCAGGTPPIAAGCVHRKLIEATCPKCRTIYRNSLSQAEWPHDVCRASLPETITQRLVQTDQCAREGNPCLPATGAKVLEEADFEFGGISMVRRYHSLSQVGDRVGLGSKWFYPWGVRVLTGLTEESTGVYVLKPGFTIDLFKAVNADTFRSGTGTEIVRKLVTGWRLEAADGTHYTFDVGGRLTSVVDVDRPSRGFSVAYDTSGRVATLTAALGAVATMSYANGRLVAIDLPASGAASTNIVVYGYDASGNLTTITYADNRVRTFHYEDAHSGLLTGITDENGKRVSRYQYDSAGHAVSSTRLLGGTVEVGKITLAYPTPIQTLVTRPLGEQVTYNFMYAGDVLFKRIQNLITPSGTTAYQYDNTLGKLQQVTDPRGAVTTYEYSADPWKRESARNEAVGQPEARRIESGWSASWNRMTSRTTKLGAAVESAVTMGYNNRGQLTARTITDPASGTSRTTTYAYCEDFDVAAPNTTCPILGLPKSVDGPRTDVSDVTSFDYFSTTDVSGCSLASGECHRRGELWKVTNALGHIVTYSRYDRAGHPTKILDANGVTTDIEFDVRGRVTRRIVRGTNNASEADDAIVRFEYDYTGLVSKVVQPDGAWTSYAYDDAGRLADVTDNLGNKIHYALDVAGNRTQEDTKDAAGTIKRTLSRVYDQLGQLQATRNAAQVATSTNTYDANKNLDTVLDANGHLSDNDYDPLNRLKKTIQDKGTGTINATTQYAYDARDNLVQVVDPKGLSTSYAYDGLGDLRQLSSPDTGTAEYTYDAAGNRVSQTDARNIMTTYAYDALNRLVSIVYPNASLNVTFSYDQPDSQTGCAASFPKGRMTHMSDSSGNSTYCYDARGNVVRKTQVSSAYVRVEDDPCDPELPCAHFDPQPLTATLDYSYDLANRLVSIAYPDGVKVTYLRDAAGRVSQVKYRVGSGAELQLVNAMYYLPFGPADKMTTLLGTTGWPRDANYWALGSDSARFALDAMGNITGAGWPYPTITQTYQYDGLDRLTDVRNANGVLIEKYTYDATGNRLTRRAANHTNYYDYPANSHRAVLAENLERTYDAAGNTTEGNWSTLPTYDDRNRLSRMVPRYGMDGYDTSWDYDYNGRGERVAKHYRNLHLGSGEEKTTKSAKAAPPPGDEDIGEAETTSFLYDESGKLLSEWKTESLTGHWVPQNYVYVDSTPVARIENGVVSYIMADQLGTPRSMFNASGVETWRWDFISGSVAFGGPNVFGTAAPAGAATLNLRFPGQYFDTESGLSYNYFRDYDSATGRYIESDPIGLYGGLATYSYVSGDPLRSIDPRGLEGHGVWSQPEFVPPPRESLECQYCECLANCVRLNDPLNKLETTLLSASGGTFPKSAAGMPRGVGGASPITTVPSTTVHVVQKCFRVPRYVVRGVRNFGRAASPLFVAYGLGMVTVEVGCAVACGDDPGLY